MRNLSTAARLALALGLVILFTSASPTPAQTGLCSENVVRAGRPPADDAFTFMPAYGKPMVGKPAFAEANAKNFGGRTNITRAWKDDHRVVASASGEIAYEYGTMHMGYDEDGKHTEFDAVMLTVFKSQNGMCQMVALTMYPLEDTPAR